MLLATSYAARYTAAEWRAAGASPARLKQAGFTAETLREADFDVEQLKSAGFTCSHFYGWKITQEFEHKFLGV